MADSLLPIPDIPDGLREAAQVGKLILFIGAGASRLAGCPGWAEFADAALQSLVDKGKLTYSQLQQIQHLNPRVKLSLARTLATDNGVEIDWRGILHRREPRDEKDGCHLYDTLFRLGKTFVTTNYDTWLDEHIPQPPLSIAPDLTPANTPQIAPIRVLHRVEDFLPAVLSESNTVIHLHGSVCDPKGMILTTQDYVRRYANDRMSEARGENRVLTFLEYLFDQKTVLFVGYGLEELEILEYVILKARRPERAPQEARHYLLDGFFSHQRSLQQALKSYYLNECGIALVPYLLDDKNWMQLLDVLEYFAQQIPASAPMILQRAHEMESLLND